LLRSRGLRLASLPNFSDRDPELFCVSVSKRTASLETPVIPIALTSSELSAAGISPREPALEVLCRPRGSSALPPSVNPPARYVAKCAAHQNGDEWVLVDLPRNRSGRMKNASTTPPPPRPHDPALFVRDRLRPAPPRRLPFRPRTVAPSCRHGNAHSRITGRLRQDFRSKRPRLRGNCRASSFRRAVRASLPHPRAGL
jgi:hypothetical protein